MAEGGELDVEVVRRARRGDEAAFEAIVRHYQARIWGLCWKVTWDEELARDVTQEVFLRLYERLDRWDPARPFEPWFLTLATNLAINARARARLRKAASLDGAGPDGEARQEPADPGATQAAQGASDAEARGAIRDAVRALPSMYAAVVGLHYLDGLGVKEIAERLGIPVGTVKIRLHRARAALRETLARFEERRGSRA